MPDATQYRIGLRSARVLCAIAALAIPAFAWLGQAAGFVDPIWMRVVITAAVLGVWVGTYASERLRRNVGVALLCLVYAITAHNAFLIAVNRLHPNMVVGTFLVMTGFIATATYTIRRRMVLGAYLVFAATSSLLAAALVERPLTAPAHFVLSVATITALAYVSVSGQIGTLTRLTTSQHELTLDIGRRERIATALRMSEARTRALLQAVPDVLLRVRRDGVVVESWNDERHPLGERLRGLRGCPLDELGAPVGPEARALSAAVEAALLSRQIACASAEVTQASEVRYAELRVAPIEVDEALVLVRDVTQEKAMEQRLRTADRLVALGTLAGGIAHEINNPLSYVDNNVEYVLQHLNAQSAVRDAQAGVEATDVVTALREARDGARRIRDIVAGLKQYTQPEQDLLGPVDVHETIRAALRMVANQLSYRAELELELNEVPLASANGSRLLQIVLNLLANALHALPDRPKQDNVVGVRTRAGPGESIVIEVRDNGSGIPERVVGRIFEPFFTTKVTGGGTGLGLYLCQRFVTSFGGTIGVESVVGKGSTFRVTLLASQRERTMPRSSKPPRVEHLRVLIVDDEPLVARSAARLLQGNEVKVCASGMEALRLCESGEYELILCDLMMPGMDGAEFYANLTRARPELSRRVVFMTGGAFTERTSGFLASVPDRCLNKPLDRRALLRMASSMRRESAQAVRAS